MPRIATSGAVDDRREDVPPMPPRFEMLKQPPCISSSESLRVARLLGELRQLDRRSAMMFFVSTSRITGTSRPRSVSTATPMLTYFL